MQINAGINHVAADGPRHLGALGAEELGTRRHKSLTLCSTPFSPQQYAGVECCFGVARPCSATSSNDSSRSLILASQSLMGSRNGSSPISNSWATTRCASKTSPLEDGSVQTQTKLHLTRLRYRGHDLLFTVTGRISWCAAPRLQLGCMIPNTKVLASIAPRLHIVLMQDLKIYLFKLSGRISPMPRRN